MSDFALPGRSIVQPTQWRRSPPSVASPDGARLARLALVEVGDPADEGPLQIAECAPRLRPLLSPSLISSDKSPASVLTLARRLRIAWRFANVDPGVVPVMSAMCRPDPRILLPRRGAGNGTARHRFSTVRSRVSREQVLGGIAVFAGEELRWLAPSIRGLPTPMAEARATRAAWTTGDVRSGS